MNIRILCVGKLKERCYVEACAELCKRLSRYASVSVTEVADEKAPESLSVAEERQVLEKEGTRLLSAIGEREHVIALAIDGEKYDSVAFSRRLSALFDGGASTIDFIIGGSLGLSTAVLSRADERLSLSDMTFPHRIARLLVLEQVYRAFKILRNETYHK